MLIIIYYVVENPINGFTEFRPRFDSHYQGNYSYFLRIPSSKCSCKFNYKWKSSLLYCMWWRIHSSLFSRACEVYVNWPCLGIDSDLTVFWSFQIFSSLISGQKTHFYRNFYIYISSYTPILLLVGYPKNFYILFRPIYN